jgi:hypothetical protein
LVATFLPEKMAKIIEGNCKVRGKRPTCSSKRKPAKRGGPWKGGKRAQRAAEGQAEDGPTFQEEEKKSIQKIDEILWKEQLEGGGEAARGEQQHI